MFKFNSIKFDWLLSWNLFGGEFSETDRYDGTRTNSFLINFNSSADRIIKTYYNLAVARNVNYKTRKALRT